MTHYFTSAVDLYAKAFFDYAFANQELDHATILVAKLQAWLATDQASLAMIAAPIYSEIEQEMLLQKIADSLNLSSGLANLLKILARNQRLSLLGEILADFNIIVATHNGYKIVEVILAEELSETEQNLVKQHIEKILLSKVQVSFELNPEILGGLVIKVDSSMIDASLAGRFAYLKEAINNKISQLELN